MGNFSIAPSNQILQDFCQLIVCELAKELPIVCQQLDTAPEFSRLYGDVIGVEIKPLCANFGNTYSCTGSLEIEHKTNSSAFFIYNPGERSFKQQLSIYLSYYNEDAKDFAFASARNPISADSFHLSFDNPWADDFPLFQKVMSTLQEKLYEALCRLKGFDSFGMNAEERLQCLSLSDLVKIPAAINNIRLSEDRGEQAINRIPTQIVVAAKQSSVSPHI